MKHALLLSTLLLIGASSCRAEEASLVGLTARSLSSLVSLRPMDYRLLIVHIPMDVSIDQSSTAGGAFEASAPYQVTVSVAAWDRQTKELLDILGRMRVKRTDVRGDYRWAIEIVAAWNRKPIALYLDEKRGVAEINGMNYSVDGQLTEWVIRYAAPVMASMQNQKQ